MSEKQYGAAAKRLTAHVGRREYARSRVLKPSVLRRERQEASA